MQASAERGLASGALHDLDLHGQQRLLSGSSQTAAAAGDAEGRAGVQKKVDLATIGVGTGHVGAGRGRSGACALAAAEAAAAAVLAAGFGGPAALEDHDWEIDGEDRPVGGAGPTGLERLRDAALSGLALGGRQELIVCASLVRVWMPCASVAFFLSGSNSRGITQSRNCIIFLTCKDALMFLDVPF
jgi:hypothetical protein